MIRVAIVEDNLAYLKALQALIGSKSDLLLVYTAETLADIQALVHARPNVVILDIDLPGMNGIAGISKVKEKCPSTAIFMLTVFEDDDKIFDSIKAGADGYLLKKDSPEKIIEAIHTVYNGESIINGSIARKMLAHFSAQHHERKKDLEQFHLTNREEEILHMIIQGKSYKQIANDCHISLQTLFSHTRNIYRKLNMHSRAEIAARFR